MKETTTNRDPKSSSALLSRRSFLGAGAATAACAGAFWTGGTVRAAGEDSAAAPVVRPPAGKRILLSCKLGMIPRELEGKALSLADRLRLAAEAGLDGVDLDQAADCTPEEARRAVQTSGVFVHNAINHAHWSQRLTSAKAEERDQGRMNIEHCIRVSHAAGGSGVLIVVGSGNDGPADVIEERCRAEIKKLLPLAASLGQMILVENVWNRMHYEHDKPPEQTAEPFIRFVDSFNSPWVGMYYDIGNHWKYGQPGEWIRAFGRRCVKLDVKGFSRASSKFTDIGEGDLPWKDVQKALDEIGFTGWATAEVGGGDVKRLTLVRQQMEKAFGI
ncbi:MAG: sugar phosphate isomerase/epimerase [Planctomycetes bacterium]|nr:sugar phosphate isomerase/epimerase [Planctomycetota bacterium]